MNVNDTITDGSVEYKLRQFASTSNIDDLGYRKPNTNYSENDIVFHKNLPPGYFLQCVGEGTTSNGDINVSGEITSIITDGTVNWSKKSIADKLEAFAYEPIPDYADLNDYTYPGTYVSTSGTNSRTLQNCPHIGNFKLIVNRNTDGGSDVWWGQQIIITSHFGTNLIYIRSHVDSPEIWHPWQKVILEDDIFPKINSAYSHNCIYRGKDLTSYFDSGEMSNDIANGSFKDIYIGDYITKSVTVDGTTYSDLKFIVMDLDYFLLSGNSTDITKALRTHHVILMPDKHFGHAQMNSTDTTTGGYVNSQMWTETIPKIVTGLENAFGAEHIVEHYELLTNAMDETLPSRTLYPLNSLGMTTNIDFFPVKVNLANENQVFGINVLACSGFEVGSCFNQFAAFKYNKALINNYYFWWWLRTVVNSNAFGTVDALCHPIAVHSTSTPNVRPYFLLK